LCQQNNVKKWPSQDWKKAYGADIFYPHKDMEIIKSHHTNYDLVFRPDILYSLMISASYGNPVAQIEIADALHQQGCARETFIDRLRNDGYTTLNNVVVGNLQYDPMILSLAKFLLAEIYEKKGQIKKSIEFYKNSDIPLSKLRILDIKERCRGFEKERPKIQDYIDLGKQFNLGEAYCYAAALEVDDEEIVKYLNLAFEGGYKPALYELGVFYRDLNNMDLSTQTFLKYGKLGYSHGYLEATFNLLGKFGGMRVNPTLEGISQEIIDQATKALKEAMTEWRNPEAAYCLGILYQVRFEEKSSQEAFKEAARLGESLAFGRLSIGDKYFPPFPHPQTFTPQLVGLYQT